MTNSLEIGSHLCDGCGASAETTQLYALLEDKVADAVTVRPVDGPQGGIRGPVIVRGRTGVRRRDESLGFEPSVSVAWIPQSPAGTV
jgi:hypothetical protein